MPRQKFIAMKSKKQIFPVKFSKVRRYLKNQKCKCVSKIKTFEIWTKDGVEVKFLIQQPLNKPNVKLRFDKLSMTIEGFEEFVSKIRY